MVVSSSGSLVHNLAPVFDVQITQRLSVLLILKFVFCLVIHLLFKNFKSILLAIICFHSFHYSSVLSRSFLLTSEASSTTD